MACKYRVKGSEEWLTEKEFKRQLHNGLIDKAVLDKGIIIPRFKANEELANTFSYGKAEESKGSDIVLGKAFTNGEISEDQLKNATNKLTKDFAKANQKVKQDIEKETGLSKEKPKLRREAKIEIAQKILAFGGELKGSKLTNRDADLVRQMIRQYAHDNLPKGTIATRDINPLLTDLSDAKTDHNLQQAFERIDAIVDKHAEAKRVQTVNDIISKVTDKSTFLKRMNDKWKGKISIEAQQDFKDYIESGALNDLHSKTQTELNDINEEIDAIISEGRADKQKTEFTKSLIRKRIRGITLETIKESIGEKATILNGYEAIVDFLKGHGGKAVVVNGLQITSKSQLDKVLKGVDLDLEYAKGYDIKSMKVNDANEITASGVKRWFKRNILQPISNLETLGIKLFSQTTKEFKELVEKNIYQKLSKALIIKEEDIKTKISQLKQIKANVFGKTSNANKRLNETPDGDFHRDLHVVTNNHITGWWATMQQDTGKEKAGQSFTERLEKDGVNTDAVKKYMENNQDLKDYANKLIDWLSEIKKDYEHIYIELTGKRFDEGVYFPTSSNPYGKDAVDPGSIYDERGNISLNAVGGNLKDRTDNSNAIDSTKTSDEILINYIKSMEHSRHFVPIANVINQVFNEQVRPDIKTKIGEIDYIKTMDYFREILMNENQFTKGNDNLNKAVNVMSSWAILGTLSWKIAQTPKQLISTINLPFQTLKYGLGILDWASGMLPNKEEREAISKMTKSSFIHERYYGGATDLEFKRIHDEAKKAGGKRRTVITKKIKSGIITAGMSPVLAGDAASVFLTGTPLFVAIYRKGIREGMNKDQAYEYALTNFANDVDNTLQTSRKDVATTQQKTPAGRMILTYKSSQILTALKVVNALKRLKTNGILSTEEKLQMFHDMVWFTVSNTAFTAISSKAIMMTMMGDDDELSEEEKKKMYYELTMDTAQSNMQGFGLFGSIMDYTMNDLRGKEHFNNVSTIDFMSKKLPSALSSLFDISVGEYKDEGFNWGLKAWDELEEKDKTDFKKVFLMKNINDAVSDWKEYMNQDQTATEAIMNFNTYKHSSKDKLWELWYGEDAPSSELSKIEIIH